MNLITDPVGDFIVRLKNATDAGKSHTIAPYSKLKAAVAETLKARGFIKGYDKRGKKAKKIIEVELIPLKIQGVARVSKPGRRLYIRVNEIKAVRSGQGAMVLSTPKGILTDREARKENVGGEALFKIW